MSEITCTTDESGWTQANLQKLFAAIKSCIPEHDRMSPYTKALKAVDWSQVAFSPFSPEACQGKWREILQKMRKKRTLTELIVEAEDVVSSHVQNMKAQYVEKSQLAFEDYKRRMVEFRKQHHIPSNCESKKKKKKQSEQRTQDEDGLPRRPPFNGYNLFCKELGSIAGVTRGLYVSVWAQRWRDLSKIERDGYNLRSKELKREYSIKLNEYLMALDEEEQKRVLTKHGIKRPTPFAREVKLVRKHPDEPKMPPRSGNAIFCKSQMELLKKEFPNSKDRFIKVSQLWLKLSTEKKEHYKAKVHESLRNYSTELQKWFKTLSSAEQKKYLESNPSKYQYLDNQNTEVDQRGELALYRPSDSEDEDLEESSSEEENILTCGKDDEEEEEEEQGDDIMFELF